MKELKAILHAHTVYSLLDSVSTPKQYIDYCISHEVPFCGITDHNQLSAHYELFKSTIGTGIQAISGNEIYLDLKDEFEGKDVYGHLTLLAYNDVGRKNLFMLFNKSFDNLSKSRFGHKKAMNTWGQLIEHREGLFAGSGCAVGCCSRSLLKGRPDLAEGYLDKLIDIFTKENLFAEFMPTSAKWDFDRKTGTWKPNQCSAYAPDGCIVKGYQLWLWNEGVLKRGLKPVMTTDSHFVSPDEKQLQDLILKSSEHGWHFYDSLHIPTAAEMYSRLDYLPGHNESLHDSLIMNGLDFCSKIKYNEPLYTATPKLSMTFENDDERINKLTESIDLERACCGHR
jgi:DNA polymerase III alpha subunit